MTRPIPLFLVIASQGSRHSGGLIDPRSAVSSDTVQDHARSR